MKPIPHADAAAAFIKDGPRTDWHDETLWFIRKKRDKAVQQIPEWELLREWASQIKDHTLSPTIKSAFHYSTIPTNV